MSFVQNQLLTGLTCQKCKKHLSHFPIYSHPELGSFCGRCQNSTEETFIRNTLYEHIAQCQKFPCCHASNGCTENLVPDKIPQHEKFCTFRQYDCPLACYANCDWKGFEKDLLNHFEQEHPVFLLRDAQFELDFINTHNENYLLPYGDNFYIVNETSDSKTNISAITVDHIGSDYEAENHLYNIILENESKSLSHILTNNIKARTDISHDIIRNVLNDPLSVVARIEVIEGNQQKNESKESKKYDTVNHDLLKELECLVCLEYMIPPIHQCLTGHSICLKCKNKLNEKGTNECPTCKVEFKNTQNFALAQIIKHLTYPCKFPECRFTANPMQIRQHEASCIFGPFECPLKEYVLCDAKVSVKDIYCHIENNHYENLLEMDTISLPFKDALDENEDCFVIRYNLKLFVLRYLYKDRSFHWAMQLVGPAEANEGYKFEINVIDNSGNNQRAYFRSPCSTLTEKDCTFNEDAPFIYINYNQIKSMITTEFSYRVCILKDKFVN